MLNEPLLAFLKVILVLTRYSVWSRKMSRDNDKTNKMSLRPAKTQISLGIRPVWSEFAVRSMGS